MAMADELIKKDVLAQLVRDSRVDTSKINVTVDNGTVTLKGEVPTYFEKICANEDAEGILGVTDVRNNLLVKYPPTRALPMDSEIKSSIRNRLAANPDLDLIDLDVTCTGGRVTLKGTVDAYWKKVHAENLVGHEPGVEMIENHLAVVPSHDILDKVIAEDIVASLESKSAVDADDVTVRVKEGNAILSGSVPSRTARRAAEEAALLTAGVKSVENKLTVRGLA
jgi:osmotically-inducible protein OsmY